MTKLRALSYYGGKSPLAPQRVGPWIASQLPRGRMYVEPFGGMCGVLLCRDPVDGEIVNDIDDRIISWWRAVRDHPDELGRLVELTPRSRTELAAQAARLDDPDPIRRALAVHIVLSDGYMAGLADGKQGFRTAPHAKPWFRHAAADIARLAARMRKVVLESADACYVIDRHARFDEAVIYCDPPYATAYTGTYGVDDVDRDALTAALAACRGFVAISGYRDEWDHLGWHRRTRRTFLSAGTHPDAQQERTEVLWTNRPISTPQPTIFGRS